MARIHVLNHPPIEVVHADTGDPSAMWRFATWRGDAAETLR